MQLLQRALGLEAVTVPVAPCRFQQTLLFVIANGRCCHAGFLRKFTDLHIALDLQVSFKLIISRGKSIVEFATSMRMA